ncbi:hypothetical protein [Nonomuraea typhae]|uniref:hypothetical protein n=1 Tax=Nonomuraea typhae TaxID=2603600 RepID=UPI0012FC5872|nr:hypothetical protein [Nonomuraea typhae]
MEELITALTEGKSGLIAVVPEIDGLEGAGTTTAAQAACADPRVRARFPRGIAWLTVGADPRHTLGDHLVERALEVGGDTGPEDWIEVLLGSDDLAAQPGEGLVVLDGVRVPHASMLAVVIAHRASVLVTARTARGLPGGATVITLPVRRWPLLDRLAGSLRTRPAREPDLRDPAARESAVHEVLETGLIRAELPESVARLLELGVFAADRNIPTGLARLLWSRTAGLSPIEADLTLTGLSALGLLTEAPDRDVLLVTDAVRGYLRAALGPGGLERVHRELVTAIDQSADVAASAEDVAYVLARLPGHLREAGMDLAGLVCDGGWIATKLQASGVAAVERDLELAGTPLAARLRRTLAQNALVLGRHEYTAPAAPTSAATLAGRLHTIPGTAREITELLRGSGSPWLECLWAPPDLPPPALRRAMGARGEERYGVAISPGGDWLVTADEICTATVWNLDGTVRTVLTGHEDDVTCVAIAPDGSWLATGSDDGTVRLWAADGTPRQVLEAHEEPVRHVVIAPDGSWLVSCGEDLVAWSPDGRLRWRAATEIEDGHRPVIGPDGAWLTYRDRTWACDGSPGVAMPVPVSAPDPAAALRAAGHFDRLDVTGLALAPGGAWVASVGLDGVIRLWDAEPGLPAHDEHLRRRPMRAVAALADGSGLITADAPRGLTLWDENGSARRTLHDRAAFTAVAGSADGALHVAADDEGLLWLMDGEGGILRRIRLAAPGRAVAVAPDGSWAAVAAGDAVQFWRADGRMLAQAAMTMPRHLAVAPGGEWVAVGGATVQVFDLSGKRIVPVLAAGSPVCGLAVAPGGTWIAAATTCGTIRRWDRTGMLVDEFEEQSAAVAVAAGPFGRWLATATEDRAVRIWDVRERRCIAALHLDAELTGCAWTPGGTRLYATGAAGLYGLRLHLPR